MARSAGVEAAVETGRAARNLVPPSSLSDWDPSDRTRSALDLLVAQHPVRDQALLPLRYGRMRASPWTYLRGAAAVMAADLATTPNTGLTVQLCGDAHVLNFGLWASPERNLLFGLRDFDETLPGPFEWDVKRLATSLVVCARTNELPPEIAERAVRAAAMSYREHMADYARWSELDVWYDRIPAERRLNGLSTRDRAELEERIQRKARKRTNLGTFRKLTTIIDGRRRIIEDPPLRRHLENTPYAGQADMAREVIRIYIDSLPDHLMPLIGRFTLTDVVQQVVGVGSVGMRVFLALAEGRSGQAPLFLQIKQATASVFEEYVAPSEFGNHGQRVVNGMRAMQSATDLLTGWTSVGGFDFYVRQFRDSKVIPDSNKIAPFLVDFAGACGHAMAKSHARTGDPVAIASYIGRGKQFADALVRYGKAYAGQTQADHADLVAAIDEGEIEAVPGWETSN